MGLAEEALRLLLSSEASETERLAQQLELYNEERQRTEQEIMQQALAWLEESPERQKDRVLVFAGEGWHDGVIGIVASRMTERFGKPCLMITLNGETAKGSARSLPGFHLFEAIRNSAHLMQKYGGHALAAGFTLPAASVEQFRDEINQYAAALGEMPFPVLSLDAKLNPARLTAELADEIALLEPFGQGNPQPVFALQRLALLSVIPLSEGKHLRLTLEQAGGRVIAMAFHTRREEFDFLPGDVVDLAVTAEANEYMGKRELTLIIKGVKHALLPNGELLRAQRTVERAQRREPFAPEEAAQLCPTREDGAAVFRLMKTRTDITAFSSERLFLLLGVKENLARVWLAAEVLRELGVLTADSCGRYALAPQGGKTDWESAGLVRFLKGARTNA
jgi:single-stranded-DNA-specific exonuclease